LVPDADREVRGSTKMKTMDTNWNAKREAKEQKRKKEERNKRKPKKVFKKLTQAQLLEEAKTTEVLNRESLAIMLKIEEEKKKIPQTRPVSKGPRIIYHSKDGNTTVTFTDPDCLPESFNAKPPCPRKAICEITGLPARYLDPKTGKYYATAAAFKVIREKYVQKVEEKCDERISQLQVLLEDKKKKKVELNKTKREEIVGMPVLFSAPFLIPPIPVTPLQPSTPTISSATLPPQTPLQQTTPGQYLSTPLQSTPIVPSIMSLE